MNNVETELDPDDGGDAGRSVAWRTRRINLMLAMLMLLLLVACLVAWIAFRPGVPNRGSVADKPVDDKAKQEAAKPDFEVSRLQTRPNSVETFEPALKAGHWTSATQEVIANHFDYQGELVVEPVPLPGVSVDIGLTRPALMPKGVLKQLELLLFVPPSMHSNLQVRLNAAASGLAALSTSQPLARMPDWQYYLVVLARNPDRLRYLRGLSTLRPLQEELEVSGAATYQLRFVAPPMKSPLPLASTALAWTNTAAVLWDDGDPAALSLEQQQALIDWLHWGGQLVACGPGTIDNLRGTFLDAYLPVDSTGTLDLRPEQIAQLNETWTVAPARPLQADGPWPVQQFAPRPGARVLAAVDGTPLVVDRRAGRGRVVAVAFSLGQRALTAWPDFDQFLSAAVLGRPPRSFEYVEESEAVVTNWYPDDAWREEWGIHSQRLGPRSALVASNVRLLTRDAFGPIGSMNLQFFSEVGAGLPQHAAMQSPGGWSDDSAAAVAARDVLLRASGLDLPSARFVLATLAAYTIVLVPLNWAVFRALRRVEWAWLAVPIITLAAAAAVVRLAQLNIGFARSLAELDIVELQPDHPRAHVTRFAALYTSLATRYSAQFADRSAVVLPFSARSAASPSRGAHSSAWIRRSPEAELEGFYVASNSLGLLHSEQFWDAGGALHLEESADGWQVNNATQLDLDAAALVVGTQVCWIGELPAGSKLAVPQSRAGSATQAIEQFDGWLATHSPVMASGRALSDLLRQLAVSPLGTTARLIGLARAVPEGMTIEPRAEQEERLSVVVAHLRYAPFAPMKRDVQTLTQVIDAHDLDRDLYVPHLEAADVEEEKEP
ncbi:MAG: hypothetical protein K1X74_13590 [Pirellulales bacterium]|nr:hypothetical protein [Pirellulales bacterium]